MRLQGGPHWHATKFERVSDGSSTTTAHTTQSADRFVCNVEDEIVATTPALTAAERMEVLLSTGMGTDLITLPPLPPLPFALPFAEPDLPQTAGRPRLRLL